MKKYLALILGVLFVLSFAASAFAIHAEIPSETQAAVAKGTTQITLGGELRSRGWYQSNISDSKNPVSSEDKAWYDQRIRLSLDANVAPGVTGFVQFETNSGTSDTYVWGSNNSKPVGLSTLQAWILYSGSGLFGFNSGVKVGHMPLALGEAQFFDHTKFGDDAIVFFMDPTKELHIGLLTIKLADQSTASTGNAEDIDAYVGLMTYKLDDKNKVGINFTNINQSSNSGVTLYGDNLKFYDLGLHASGNAAGFGYKAELDWQFGDYHTATDKVKFKGYGLLLGANFNLNPVTLRANVAYGSGDADSTDNKRKDFQTFLGGDQHYTLVYEYRVKTTAGNTATGISNTTYLNLGVDFAAAKDITLSADGYLLRATKTADGVSKSAGWEVDAKMKYALAKNLTYQIDAGYFKAGDYYDDTLSSDAKGATVLRNTLTLSF